MSEKDEDWFQQRIYRNSELRRKGVKLRPKSPRQTKPLAHPNEDDTKFLTKCGVKWEPEPTVQLPLDFSGQENTE